MTTRARRIVPPPDLQKLVARYGNGYAGVPAKEWERYDRACERYRASLRAGELEIIDEPD